MKERPIPFSGPMVRAILEGRKTQTRRLNGLEDISSYPGDLAGAETPFGPAGYHGAMTSTHWLHPRCHREFKACPGLYHLFIGRGGPSEINPIPVRCPYGIPGDRLWVRETHAIRRVDYDLDEDESGPCESEEVYYHATPRVGRRRWVGPTAPPPTEFQGQPHSMTYLVESSPLSSGPAAHIDRWTPSTHMPRWASRIDLEIVGVRVERLQDIAEGDAQAEGIERGESSDPAYTWVGAPERRQGARGGAATFCHRTARDAFVTLWNHINGDRATWESNPWVWVVEFKRVRP